MNDLAQELVLVDPKDGCNYTLAVTQAVYERAMKDKKYATELLAETRSDLHSNVLENVPSNNFDCDEKTIWPYNAVVALIESMATHHCDLSHHKKKKYVFTNISNDLISKQICMTGAQCQNKWRSLLRSYKSAKDKVNSTGSMPTRFQFFNQIDEIVGQTPANCGRGTLESAVDSVAETSASGEGTDISLDENISPDLHVAKKRRTNVTESAKQKRHEDRMIIEQQKIALEREKLDILREFLNK